MREAKGLHFPQENPPKEKNGRGRARGGPRWDNLCTYVCGGGGGVGCVGLKSQILNQFFGL